MTETVTNSADSLRELVESNPTEGAGSENVEVQRDMDDVEDDDDDDVDEGVDEDDVDEEDDMDTDAVTAASL